MRKKTLQNICAVLIACVLVFFMCSIAINVVRKALDRTENKQQSITIAWAKEYPFAESDQRPQTQAKPVNPITGKIKTYEAKIAALEEKIGDYTDKMFWGRDEMIQAGSAIESALGWNLKADSGDGVIYLTNGYLAGRRNRFTDEILNEIADSVLELSDYAAEQGIPFLYANTPSKNCRYDMKLPEGTTAFSNDNADRVIEMMRERGIPVLDYREEMEAIGMDHYGAFYITDHHWTTEASLWAAGVLAEKCNELGGFAFDPQMFEKEQYDCTVYESYFLGSEGRTVTLARTDLEDYCLIVPKYETNYTLTVPSKKLELTGSYTEALFDMNQFKRIASYSSLDYLDKGDAYSCSYLRNDPLTIIRNNLETNNEGKKILIIADSFGDYLNTYLASDVEEIDVIYPAGFTGSFKSYIEKTQPDMVIVLMSQENLSKIDYSTHTSMFDFR